MNDLLGGSQPLPGQLDAVSFTYRGVQCHVYGVLHGLRGGTNRQYREFVNRTIRAAPGLRFGETQFRRLYEGLDVEMDDWLEFPLRDAFMTQIAASLMPWRFARVVWQARRERRTLTDRFGAGGVRRLQDIGGSPAFHLLSPDERRRVAGFLPPHAYLVENCRRRRRTGRFAGPVFPDNDWFWLARIEPYINIPLRSIHMLEYAVERARLANTDEVSLFVGEIHNSDMAWYSGWDVQTEPDELVRNTVTATIHRAREYAASSRRASRLPFLAATLSGAFAPLVIWLGVGVVALRLLHHF
ncbi:hypothetical protein ACFQVB_38305 [Paraburkholderia humisilvae]|uniref:hypothetical protein n=1 Tax=Paraburkholderia humisilvae TaxID=627669 RepID=UPI0036220617